MKQVTLGNVRIDGTEYMKIESVNKMDPFFMSIMSDSNHWLFISSNGGITAGRKNAEYALFPYATDDKIEDSIDHTGSKTIIKVSDVSHSWEPFSMRNQGVFNCSRHLYKSIYGNKIRYEEINHDLHLTFIYEWSFSDQYGFVRMSQLQNNRSEKIALKILDGIQNVMPSSVPSDLQNGTSNLVNAYKHTEKVADSSMAIYALSAVIVDRAEPSEALKANVAWSIGMKNPTYLLSSKQVDAFRDTGVVTSESDVKGARGAYLTVQEIELDGNKKSEWMILADVNKSQSHIADLLSFIKKTEDHESVVKNDVEEGTRKLIQLCASADGLQLTEDMRTDTRHYANVMFNIMRGGVIDRDYEIERKDFLNYLKQSNLEVFNQWKSKLSSYPETFSLFRLMDNIGAEMDLNLHRLCTEYLPLKFSRRHGDPSRPWNKFSINTRSEVDGSKILDYEGNWRDIFQNWEALVISYPYFIHGMIHKFLNASTFDGYNPYRIYKKGVDWESIEPDDPWSYIGYWGDHQIIYLLKLLEVADRYEDKIWDNYLGQYGFTYTEVPYKIKGYEDITKNAKDTIDFDAHQDEAVRNRMERLGADGALLRNSNGAIHQVGFLEKIMASLLAKLTNFIPDGGIWMNTQRPEWNDANNALVGNGVSMVTLYYIRRYLGFLKKILKVASTSESVFSIEIIDYFKQVAEVFHHFSDKRTSPFLPQMRKEMVDQLGRAASGYRLSIYKEGFSGNKNPLSHEAISRLLDEVSVFIEETIRQNQRSDQLYHAYNLMTYSEDGIQIDYLSEMLEGQVAVLSSGVISAEETVSILDSMRDSALYRSDQNSYMLYPAKELPGFLDKNIIPTRKAESSPLLSRMIAEGNTAIVQKSSNGNIHFNPDFRNAHFLEKGLNGVQENLDTSSDLKLLIDKERQSVLSLYEEVFNHKAFTGRSGTFYGYEGLGSIYWHMVSKLRLAVIECIEQAKIKGVSDAVMTALTDHYYTILDGIGSHKEPEVYGAFPTDPYSHTPGGKGAQQPGMTGQVKEDILSRFGELGVVVEQGCLRFSPYILMKSEFLKRPKTFSYVSVGGEKSVLEIASNSLVFTYCQVPIIYTLAAENKIELYDRDQLLHTQKEMILNQDFSSDVFSRSGKIYSIRVYLTEDQLISG